MAPMAKKDSVPLTAKLARFRVWIQSAFLMVWLDPFALRMHSVCSPVFHCYSCPLAMFACPIGVIANFSALHVFPFLAVGTLALFGALLGGVVCGWMCPFGFLQDLLGRIPTPKFTLPGWMGYGKYVVLVTLVLAVPYWLGYKHPLFFCSLCPAAALEGAVPNMVSNAIKTGELVWPGVAKMSILVVVLGAALFTWRPWCTVLCPLGAIYGLLNRVSLLFVRFQPHECNDCELCSKLCRYHAQGERRGGDMRCIRCLDCTRCSAVTLSHVFQRQSTPPDGQELVQIGQDQQAP